MYEELTGWSVLYSVLEYSLYTKFLEGAKYKIFTFRLTLRWRSSTPHQQWNTITLISALWFSPAREITYFKVTTFLICFLLVLLQMILTRHWQDSPLRITRKWWRSWSRQYSPLTWPATSRKEKSSRLPPTWGRSTGRRKTRRSCCPACSWRPPTWPPSPSRGSSSTRRPSKWRTSSLTRETWRECSWGSTPCGWWTGTGRTSCPRCRWSSSTGCVSPCTRSCRTASPGSNPSWTGPWQTGPGGPTWRRRSRWASLGSITISSRSQWRTLRYLSLAVTFWTTWDLPQVGTMVATDLNLTVETLKPKDDNSDTGLAKKVRREFLLLPIKLIRRRWSSCHKV